MPFSQDQLPKPQRRRARTRTVGLLVVGFASLAGISATVWALQAGRFQPVSAAGPAGPSQSANAQRPRFPVMIRRPKGPPRLSTDVVDPHGNAVTVACTSCHATRPPDRTNQAAEHLKDFHVGLQVSHGSISCLSCHNSEDYDALKLADGARVEFSDVMQLCAQCHGPQARDFAHNVHGGMNGFWDRTRGAQTRLNCVDCHHPHAPQFPKMRPTFKPFDRFLSPQGADH